MTTSVDIRLLVGIACTLLVLSLCLAAYLQGAWTERFRRAVTLYGASLASLAAAAGGVFLSQTAPFVVSTFMLITGAHFGIVFAYLAVHEALQPQRRIRPILITAALLCLAQGVLSVLFRDAAMLILTSSLVNGTVSFLACARLWALASTVSPRIRLLITAPFVLIGMAYILRLGLMAASDPTDWFILASSVIAFTLGVASLYLGFALIIIRESALSHDLRMAREQAEEAMRQRTRFFSQINHELRTPLNGILGLTRVLSTHIEGPAGHKTLKDLQSSAALLKTVVDDVLDFAKLDSDSVRLESIAFDLTETIGAVVAQYHTLAAEKGVTLHYNPASDPQCWRKGDPTRLTQILHNILANAVKFTAAGEIVVTVRCAQEGNITLSVTDSGIGMDADQLRSLFVPFRQAAASTTRQFGGTGLGMSIVRMLVDAMGGVITVHSTAGTGTRVELTLPMPTTEPPLPLTGPETVARPTTGHAALQILCADDDDINRLVLQAFLKELAIDPAMAASGAEAIARAQDTLFDAYLIDINMPGMGGVETLAKLREIDARRDRPSPLAVAVTANVLQQDVHAYLAAGFDAHLPKPIMFEELSAVLHRAAGR